VSSAASHPLIAHDLSALERNLASIERLAAERETTLSFASIASARPLLESGELKALGVTTIARARGLPDVPPITDAGLPGYEFTTWYGVLAPAGLDPAIVALLNERLAQGGPAIDNLLQFELDYLGQHILIEIDCLDHRAGHVAQFTPQRPMHRFRLDAISSAEWLNGKRFEEVIGMRRFTLRREPNLYLPEVLKIVNTVV